MPEHRIRFRGGWERLGADGEAGAVNRLTLPTSFEGWAGGAIRLARRFGRPPFDPASESARLELRGVPGLRGIWLNGDDLGPIPVDVVDWSVPLGSLEARNTLSLEVEPPGGMEGPWGAIALVIGPRSGAAG